MKAIILNGSLEGQEYLMPINTILEGELKKAGWNAESIVLRDCDIKPCIGCFGCWNKTPGICITVDDAVDLNKKIIKSDLLILLTPLTFGGYSSELKKMVDRLIPLIQPGMTKIRGETHHLKRYKSYPSILGIGVSKKADEEEEQIFALLVERNSLNFHAPKHSTCAFHTKESTSSIKDKIKQVYAEVGVFN